MAVHKKTLLIISVAIAGFIGVIYTASSNILSDSVRKAEEHDTRQSVKGVLNVFRQTQDDFSSRFADFSAWHDTHTFIEDSNKDYVKANLVPEVLALKVNLVLYINSSGGIVYGTGFDLKNKKKTPIPQALREHLSPNDLLLNNFNSKSNVAGIVLLPEGPMMITSQPIMTSKGEGPIRGKLIYGRYLDASGIQNLISSSRLSLTVHGLNEARLPPDFQTVRSSLLKSWRAEKHASWREEGFSPPLAPGRAPLSALSEKEPILIRRLSEQTIAGYSLLPDIYGKPALLLRVDVPREIYKQGQTSLYYLIESLLVVGLLFGGVVLLVARLVLFQQEPEELKKLNQLKDDFLSTVSHELRTPMTNIKMAIQMLGVSCSQDAAFVKREQVHRYLQILQDECAREISLINNLLDLQGLEAGNHSSALEKIHLQTWLFQLIEPFKERVDKLQQTLQLDISPHIPPLVSSPSSLERILAELLNNACKYTLPGEQITLSAHVKSGMMQLSVSNSGIEIPASEQSQIFDKFYRIRRTDPWRQGGTGLGLALAQKLTKHLGGSIWVESASGQTCFTVELPLLTSQLS